MKLFALAFLALAALSTAAVCPGGSTADPTLVKEIEGLLDISAVIASSSNEAHLKFLQLLPNKLSHLSTSTQATIIAYFSSKLPTFDIVDKDGWAACVKPMVATWIEEASSAGSVANKDTIVAALKKHFETQYNAAASVKNDFINNVNSNMDSGMAGTPVNVLNKLKTEVSEKISMLSSADLLSLYSMLVNIAPGIVEKAIEEANTINVADVSAELGTLFPRHNGELSVTDYKKKVMAELPASLVNTPISFQTKITAIILEKIECMSCFAVSDLASALVSLIPSMVEEAKKFSDKAAKEAESCPAPVDDCVVQDPCTCATTTTTTPTCTSWTLPCTRTYRRRTCYRNWWC